MKKTLLFLTVFILSSSLLFSQNIDVTVDVYQPTCPGQNATVYANVTISTNYTLLWSNGSAMYYNYLTAGTYFVTATDVPTGDTAIATVVIIDPPGLNINAESLIPLCPGASNGSIDLTVTGNTAPYSYYWSTGSTNQDLYNVSAGLYSVTVSDINNCNYYLDSIAVTEIPAIVLNIIATDATCGSNDGIVSASPGGAGGTFYYQWDDPDHSVTDTVYNLPANIYHVTVTTEEGCISYGSATVNNSGSPILIPYYSNILCNGNNTGSAWVNPQGGIPPFTYLWSNNETSYLADSLPAGPINVTVTDSLGCISIRSFNIIQPPAFNVSLNKSNLPCISDTVGGSMWLNVEGGTPDYTYLWSNGATVSNIYDLTTGIYHVTVTDINSCAVILSDTIFDAVPIVINYNVTEPTCQGNWNGSVDITVTGGAPPYSYFWSGAQGFYSYNEDISGIIAGDYSLNINDVNSCSEYRIITLTDPPAMYADAITTDVICNGDSTGAIDITVYNGLAPYTFSWNYTVGGSKQISTSENSFVISGLISNQEDLTNVPAGWYLVDITDSLGCLLNTQFNIYENTAISFNFSPTNPACGLPNGYLLSQPVYGGLPPYSFNWSNGDTSDYADSLVAGQYSLTVTDTAGCQTQNSIILNNINGPIISAYSTDVSCFGFAEGSAYVSSSFSDTYLWSTGSINDTITDLLSGTYYVTATDTSGCFSIGSVFVYQPEQLTITFNSTNPACAGDTNGFVNATVGGGSWEWSLLWSNDSTNSYFSNVSAGTYTLTVTDLMNPGCQKIDSVIVNEPPPIVINSVTSTDVTCYGAYDGTITIDASAGGQTLEYSIGETGFFPQNIITDLSPGNYQLYIRFSSVYTCNLSYQNSILINEPTQLSGTYEQTSITCYGANDGTITFTPFGGTPPYQYSVDGASTFSPDSLFSDLGTGTYILKIKDANGCMIHPGDVTFSEPADINMNLYGSTLICNGNTDGSAEMIVYGGFPPYSFNWSNGDTTQNIMNLIAGTYFVTVSDNHNCNYIDSAIVDEPVNLQIASVTTNALCFGSSDGTLDLTISGGTPSYTFLWDDNSVNEDRSGLSAGTYFVTVTDGNGCLIDGSFIITEPSASVIAIVNSVNVSCNGYQNGIAYGSASGGTVPYSFYWSTDATSDSITNLATGIYMLTVTDVNGCQAADTFNITEPGLLIIDSFNVVNPTCFGFANGSITVYASGGTGTYQYTSDSINFQSTGYFNSLSAGTYSVEVIDENNCYYSIPAQTISEPDQLVVTVTSTNVSCFGGNNGTASISVTGGTPPYSYLWNNVPVIQVITDIVAGTYIASITDANACTISDTVIITEPAMLVSSVSTTNVTCFGLCDGTATVTPTGGNSPYTYAWNNAAVTPAVTGCAGLWSVTVTDANGCTSVSSANITEPEALSLVTSFTVSACNICNGTATVIPGGGTIPYNYLWNNNGVFDTTATADSLCAGTITVTVTDINGCNATANVNVTSQALSVISGEAHWTGGNLPDNTADVELYRILNVTDAELAYTIPLAGSQFSFSDVEYGQYFVKVNITDGALLPNVLATYLDSTYLWEFADTVNITCANNYSLHLPMYEMTQPAGSPIGTISGYITYADFPGGGKGINAAEGVTLTGEPVPGAEIYVELEPDDEPIVNTTTNDTGYYELSGLQGGNTYSMSVDIPGLPMITTYTHISINNDSTEYTQMNFYVDTSETSGGIFIGTSTPVIKHENAVFNLELYPNPFNEYMYINYALSKSGNVNLQIYDILGKVVTTLVSEKQLEGAYKYVFDASSVNLAEGTYIVKLHVDNTVFIKKILQIK